MKSKFILLLLAVFTFIPTYSYSQSGLNTANVQTSIRVSFDGEAITVDNTSGGVALTASKINPVVTDKPSSVTRATLATCVNTSTNNINVLSNGTAPTTSVGIPIPGGSGFKIFGYDDILAFRAIRSTSSSGTLYCIYSR